MHVVSFFNSLEVELSFVSLEIGIPFATMEGALTIFDCDAAARCSNKLQFPHTK